MKRNIQLYALVILLIGSWACNPEPLPTPVEEDPEFFLEGRLGGLGFNWEAGVNDKYILSDAILNKWNYWEMTSSIIDKHADRDSAWIGINLMDHTDFDNSFNPDLRFQPGSLDMIVEENWVSKYRFSLSSQMSRMSIDEKHWIINGTPISGDPQELEFDKPGSHLVCLKVITFDQDTLHTCKRVNMSGFDTYEPHLRIVKETFDSVFVQLSIDHKECDTWLWDNEEIYTDNLGYCKVDLEQNNIRRIEVLSDGKIVTDILFRLSDYNIDGAYEVDIVDFQAGLKDLEIKNDQHSKADIYYFDPANGMYSTRFYNGPNGKLEILGAEPYKENEFGHSTVKLNLKGSFILATEFGDIKELELENAQLAFPDPK